MAQPLFGLIALKIDGAVYNVKGSVAYNLGIDKREAVVGAERIHGFKVTPQAAYAEGEISDRGDLNLKDLVSVSGATVTIELRNGKVIVLRQAEFTGEGTANTEEGNIAFRFDAISAEEIS